MKPLSVIVTCKGRLEHLMQTAPKVLADPRVEYILVDWGCPDGSSLWLAPRYPSSKIIRVAAGGFHKTRANNAGARVATSPYLLFADADTVLERGFFDWLIPNLLPDRFLFVQAWKDGVLRKDITGVLAVPRMNFLQVGGYDEGFGETYGNEDVELRLRLAVLGGLKFTAFPEPLVSGGLMHAIPHPDSLRTTYYREKDLEKSSAMTLEYLVQRYRQYTGGRNLNHDFSQGPNSDTIKTLLGAPP